MDSNVGSRPFFLMGRPFSTPDMRAEDETEQPYREKFNSLQAVFRNEGGSNDILHDILERASFTDGVYLKPHVFASVCRRFRSLALATPRIWTYIRMHDPGHTGFQMEREWLARSKDCDLNIDIDWRVPDWNGSEDHLLFTFNEMWYGMSLLVGCSLRWKTFRIAADSYSPFDALLPYLLPLGVPRLVTLELVRTTARERPLNPTPRQLVRIFMYGTPQIRRLVLSGVYIDWDHIPVGNLEELEVCYHMSGFRPTRANFDRVLIHSPNLNSLVMNGSGPNPRTPLHGWHLLSNLRHMHLGVWSPLFSSEIVQLYRAPRLRSLVLDWIRDAATGMSPKVFFDAIIHHELMKELEELTIKHTDIDTATFALVTRYFSRLKTLRLFPISADAHLFLWSLPIPGPANVLLGPCNVDAINVPSVRQFEQQQPAVNVELVIPDQNAIWEEFPVKSIQFDWYQKLDAAARRECVPGTIPTPNALEAAHANLASYQYLSNAVDSGAPINFN